MQLNLVLQLLCCVHEDHFNSKTYHIITIAKVYGYIFVSISTPTAIKTPNLPCLNPQVHRSSVHLCIAGMCPHHTNTEVSTT